MVPTHQPRNYPSSTTTTSELTNNAEGLGAYTILTDCLATLAPRIICKADANDATAKTTLFAQPQRQHCNDTIVNFSVTKNQALDCAPARFATGFCALLHNPFSTAWCFIIAKSALSAKSVAAPANVLPILTVYWTEIAEFCATKCNQR